MWPFKTQENTGIEKRSTSYTAIRVRAAEEEASGQGSGIGKYGTIAVREICAGIWGRAFASGEIYPMNLRDAITPGVLEFIGRQLIICGEMLFQIRTNGMLSLRPASHHTITGDPDAWRYKLDMPGPSKTATIDLPAASVLHFRYAPDVLEPWRGCSPVDTPATTAALARILEKRLDEESGTVTGFVLPLPGTAEDNAALRMDLADLAGGLTPVQSVSTNFDSGGMAPAGDWKSHRLGAEIPQTSIALRREVNATILAACGISPLFLETTEGASALREAYRTLLAATIQPVSKLIAAEFSDKLDQEVTIDFTDMAASDIQGRARAYKSITDGENGIDPQIAAKLVGFDLETVSPR